MLTRRLIACLDVKDGRVVKGTRFQGLRDVGDPVELAARYEQEGADEIVLLDISATAEGRRTLLDVVQRTADRLFIPLGVGGGVCDVDDVGRLLRAGADKVGINSGAVARPDVITEASARYGAQCVVASIDAKRESGARDDGASSRSPRGSVYRVFTHGGTRPTGLDAVAWARRCEELGAGELLLTSIDRDGGRRGYDLELTREVVDAVTVPVIASGGAGSVDDLREAFENAGAQATLVAGILHDGDATIASMKEALAAAGLAIRPVAGNDRAAAEFSPSL
jgi:imidazole glycerol-phosphate synthase subunit HisF